MKELHTEFVKIEGRGRSQEVSAFQSSIGFISHITVLMKERRWSPENVPPALA